MNDEAPRSHHVRPSRIELDEVAEPSFGIPQDIRGSVPRHLVAESAAKPGRYGNRSGVICYSSTQDHCIDRGFILVGVLNFQGTQKGYKTIKGAL